MASPNHSLTPVAVETAWNDGRTRTGETNAVMITVPWGILAGAS
jgi:hypothetical protein